MAVSGLYDLVSGIVKHLRREQRLNKIANWRVATGCIREFRTVEGGSDRLRPVIKYTYDANGERHHGSATGWPLEDGIVEIRNAVEAMVLERTAIQVRYDPEEPHKSCFLNSDNPHFAFDIDHDLF